MRIRNWFGWETLLSFSLAGIALSLLPIPSVYVWIAIGATLLFSITWVIVIHTRTQKVSFSKAVGWLSLGFALLVVWCVASLLWSPVSDMNLFAYDLFIISNVAIPTIALFLRTSESTRLARRWLVGLVFVALISSLYCAYLSVISPGSLYETFWTTESQAAYYLSAGQSLMTLSIVCILWAAYSRAGNKRIGFIIGAVSFWLALDAGGRGTAMWGILAIVAMLSMDFFHNRAPMKRVRSLFYFGLIVPALGWVIVNNFQFFSETVPVFQRFASDSERGYDDLSSLGIRFLQYEQALSHFFDSPILGQGALSFRALTGTDAIYPHNIVLDVLGDLGLIGLMIFMLLIALGLVASWRIAATGGVPQKICAALFLFLLGLEMSSGYLYWSKMWPWLVLLIQVQPGRRRLLRTPDVVGR